MRKPLLSILLTVGLAFAVTATVVAEDALRPMRRQKARWCCTSWETN